MSPATAIRLLVRLIAVRRSAALILVLVALVSGLVVGTVLAARVSTEAAFVAGLLHGRGGLDASVVQAPAELSGPLNRQRALQAVATDDGFLSTDSRGVDVVVLTAAVVPGLGLRVLEGRLPAQPDEIAVSPKIVEELDLQLGQSLTFNAGSASGRARVVAVVVNPGSREDRNAYREDRGLAARQADYWIADPSGLAQLERHELIGAHLDSGALSVSSNRVLVSEGLDHRPLRLQVVGAALWISAGVALLLLLTILAGLSGRARKDVGDLVASGVRASSGWSLYGSAAGLLVTVGAALGVLLAAVLVRYRGDEFGAWFNQWWSPGSGGAEELTPVVLVLAATVPLFASSRYVVAQIADPKGLREPRGERARALRPLAWSALGSALVVVSVGASAKGGPGLLYGAVGVALLGFGFLPVMVRVARSRLPLASGRLLAEVLERRAGALLLGSVVAALAAAYVVATALPSEMELSGAARLQPPGSLVVLQVPDKQLPEVRADFLELGGTKVKAYGMPTSRLGDVRGAAGGGNDLYYVAFDRELTEGDVVASSELAEQRLIIATYSDAVLGRRIPVRATADERLGGNLPAVTLAPHGRVARALEMTGSGFSVLALLDFDRLRDSDQSELRALISRVAPAAISSFGAADDVGAADRSTGRAVAVAGTMMAGLVAAGGLFSAGVELAPLRRNLHALGLVRSLRRRLAWVSVVLELIPLVGVIAFLGWMDRARPSSYLDPVLISVWMLPLVGQLVIGVSTINWFYRRSSR